MWTFTDANGDPRWSAYIDDIPQSDTQPAQTDPVRVKAEYIAYLLYEASVVRILENE